MSPGIAKLFVDAQGMNILFFHWPVSRHSTDSDPGAGSWITEATLLSRTRPKMPSAVCSAGCRKALYPATRDQGYWMQLHHSEKFFQREQLCKWIENSCDRLAGINKGRQSAVVSGPMFCSPTPTVSHNIFAPQPGLNTIAAKLARLSLQPSAGDRVLPAN